MKRRPTSPSSARLKTVTRQLADLIGRQAFADLADIIDAAHEREVRRAQAAPRQRERRRKVPA
ncbi:MAG: hypothetical protein K2R98_08855 [Gemmataceae bacterium]|nr:hypothetical protein [Gemmataceae bacterium]